MDGAVGPGAFFQLQEVKRADGMGQVAEKMKDRLTGLDAMKAKAQELVTQG